MQVSRKSPLTGKLNTMELDITQEQIDEVNSPNRRLIQQIFPGLTPAEREFVKTGYTQEDWDTIFVDQDKEVTDAGNSLRTNIYGN